MYYKKQTTAASGTLGTSCSMDSSPSTYYNDFKVFARWSSLRMNPHFRKQQCETMEQIHQNRRCYGVPRAEWMMQTTLLFHCQAIDFWDDDGVWTELERYQKHHEHFLHNVRINMGLIAVLVTVLNNHWSWLERHPKKPTGVIPPKDELYELYLYIDHGFSMGSKHNFRRRNRFRKFCQFGWSDGTTWNNEIWLTLFQWHILLVWYEYMLYQIDNMNQPLSLYKFPCTNNGFLPHGRNVRWVILKHEEIIPSLLKNGLAPSLANNIRLGKYIHIYIWIHCGGPPTWCHFLVFANLDSICFSGTLRIRKGMDVPYIYIYI
jgi:hypothetical protein